MYSKIRPYRLFLVLSLISIQPIRAASCAENRRGSAHSFDCSDCGHETPNASSESGCGKSCVDGVGTPFLPRPQGLNSAALFNPFYYGCGIEDRCMSFSLGYRYNQIFRERRLARCLFGSEILRFKGSQVHQALHDNKKIFLADNFGLAPDFQGKLMVKPKIKNHIIDIMTRVELGSWAETFAGAYLAFNASVVHSVWQLNPCETRQTATRVDNTFAQLPPCYMASTTNSSIEPAGDLNTALSGDFLFGDMQSVWRFGRFEGDDGRQRRDTKLANIDIILGYDFVGESYHVGGFLKGVAPTGTQPDSRTVFQAIIGNGHHWEFGGGVDAHYDLWMQGDHCLGAYLNGCVTHLFKDTQWRTFDFKKAKHPHVSGFFSRYVLLKEFDASGNYADRLINAVNFTTRRIKSSFDVQGDASLRLIYRLKRCEDEGELAIGVGYNVYGRSQEDISGLCDCCPEFSNRRFGIKGVNGVCAREFIPNVGLTGETRSLSSTSHKARIFDDRQVLKQVDHAVKLESPLFVAWNSPTNPETPEQDLIVAEDSEIDGAPAPVLVSQNDLDIKRIPGQLTHKVFAHIDYQWQDCSGWQPYFGVGGEAEFADSNDACRSCTANQWGVWVRGGANF